MRLPRPLTLFRRDIPGCTVLSRLGSGRYGVCYLVRREDGALAVLKRFRRRDPAEHGWEAVILSQLRHPAVPELLGVCVLPRHYGFWLEYMPGKSLERLLFRDRRVFSDREIFQIGGQLLDTLAYLHSRGVVHGDVRLANLLWDGERLSLLDFGLSRYAGAGPAPEYDLPFAGEVLLYLLYSRYRGPKDGVWYEQLPLSPGQRDFLRRLMGLEAPFPTLQVLQAAFRACFGPR